VLSERQAKSYLVDVIQISDMGMILDFQRRGGFRPYLSPQMEAFKPEYKSKPEGFWTWGSIIMAGIAYNPNNVKAAEAPKKWEDLLDPKWKDSINVKVSNSGLQHGVWYMLKPILGMEYFKKFAEQKPRAFDSYVQQYGRLVDGQDKIIMGAQYSGYIEFKAKGAPLAFVFPETGVPAVSETYGIVADGPHPNAAELFMDWFLAPVAQQALSDALLLHSPRDDAPAPAGSVPLTDMQLLVPPGWNAFAQDRPDVAHEWDRIRGARRCAGEALRPRRSWQAIVTVAMLLIVGFLVILPLVFVVEESLNVGDPMAFPPTQYGIANYLAIFDEDIRVLWNTLIIAVMATAMAIVIGFTLAWILTRTDVPGRAWLERLMELPYYMTPLVGALAWAIIAGPKSGFVNQLWKAIGGSGDLADIYTHFGIAWVMALFEGTVAFVMISAAMKSMDPALEESARVMGASKLRTTLTVTLPLVMPGVLGATLFVFAEMLGSFAAALVIGIPARIYVITTAIWDSTLAYPPDYGRASAMGLALFVVMFGMLTFYRYMIVGGSFATITGKAFR